MKVETVDELIIILGDVDGNNKAPNGKICQTIDLHRLIMMINEQQIGYKTTAVATTTT